MPKRIQMSRQRPWRADNPDAIMVARPARYGNPFKVSKDITPERAVELFRMALELRFHRHPAHLQDLQWDLRGRDLACWCPLDAPCHGDVLLELANG